MCPDKAICEDGYLKECETGFKLSDAKCVEDEEIINEARRLLWWF